MFHRDTCHSEIYQRSSRDKRFPREACLDLGDVKVVKEGGPQIERGMVFLRDTCHCFFFHRNISDKRLPREGCSDQGDVKEEKAVKRVFRDTCPGTFKVDETHCDLQ